VGHSAATPGARGDDTERRELKATASGRIDAVIAAACPDLTRARVQRLIAAGHVTLNGAPARKSTLVEAGDGIAVDIPPSRHEPMEVDLDLPVLYEDPAVLAIDKPAGLAVHGAPGDSNPTVAGWFLARYPAESVAFDAERPGIVHRLDKDTTGVLLLAKTPAAQAALSRAFERRETRKEYLAVTSGVPPATRAVIEAPIGRHPGDRTRMAVVRHGRAARTEYEVLAAGRDGAFLLVRPESGRTHQIRVHLAGIGAPVAGDTTYGRGGASRQLLHAWRIDAPHPGGGRLVVTAPMPRDMLAAVRALGAGDVALAYTKYAEPRRTPESP
jgi:23S rRNA pseudouridine1911/1915/1917 synthase